VKHLKQIVAAVRTLDKVKVVDISKPDWQQRSGRFGLPKLDVDSV